ncbi:hypothetical protein ACW0JT_08780 [Arthrobacter sp. SA17]
MAGPELPGSIIAHEAKIIDGLQDAFLGSLGNTVRVVQDVGNRADGDARLIRNILNAGRPIHFLPVLLLPASRKDAP